MHSSQQMGPDPKERPVTTGGSCDMIGPQFDLTSAELHEMYGSNDVYIAKLSRRLDELVEARWYRFQAEQTLEEARSVPSF